jgi:hypothetical protein
MTDIDVNVVGLSKIKPKSNLNWKVVGAIIGVIVLAVGVFAGILLVKQQQNISEKASELMCTDPAAEQCPGTDGILRNCHPPENSGGPTESACDAANRTEFCGTRCFVCPSAGGTWTPTELSKCAVAPTPTSTPTPTPTSSSSQCNKMYFIKITNNVKACTETTSTYNSTRIDCTGGTNQTCEQNLAQFNANITTGVCYTSNALCLAALATPTPTATATVSPTPTAQSGLCEGSFTMSPSNSEVVGTKITVNATAKCPNGVKSIEVKVETTSKGFIYSSSGSLSFETSGMRAGSYMVGITINDNINPSMLHRTTTNLDLLSTPKPTSTSTANPTRTPTSTPRATSTSVAQSTATSAPIPVTGASLPTIVGSSLGVIMILVSLALAL